MSVAVSVYKVCEHVCLCVKGRLCMLFFYSHVIIIKEKV